MITNKINKQENSLLKKKEKQFIEGIVIIGKQKKDTRAQSSCGRRIWWGSEKKNQSIAELSTTLKATQ